MRGFVVNSLSVDRALSKANSFARKGKIDDAIHLYQCVLQSFPDNQRAKQGLSKLAKHSATLDASSPPQGVIDSILSLYNNGHLEATSQQIIGLLNNYPNSFTLWNILGACLKALGQTEHAITAFTKVTELNPNYPDGHYNLGVILQNQNKFQDAINAYQKVCALNPHHAEAHYNLGTIHNQTGNQKEAITAYQRAISANPAHSEAYNNLGNIHKNDNNFEEALKAYSRALVLDPENADIHNNIGSLHNDMGAPTKAIQAYKEAILLNPNFAEAHFNKANALSDLNCIGEALVAYNQSLAIDPEFFAAACNKLFCLASRQFFNRTEYLQEVSELNKTAIRKRKKRYTDWVKSSPEGCLRVGFVSADLHDHPVGYFTEKLLKNLDNKKIECIAYSNCKNNTSALRKRITPYFREWHSIASLNDSEAAELIYQTAPDILIDLSGHTSGNRLSMFSYKPAAIQATWLGYFASTGIDEMDFIIGDKFVTPHDADEEFTEKIIQLPNSYLCFSAPEVELEIEETPALRENEITFGCFNKANKISDPVIQVWSEILKNIPNSSLFFQGVGYDGHLKKSISEKFEALGVSDKKLLFAKKTDRTELLKAYNKVDIALDPFPYPGGTTTCEALWMGVPTITKKGFNFLSRVGETIAFNSGNEELCAQNDEEYVSLAITLANDIPQLNRARMTRRQKTLNSALFNAKLFAKDFENLMFTIYESCKERE